MREFITLAEKWVHTARGVFGRPDVDVFLNPDRQELYRELKAAKFGEIKGIVLPEDLYIFSGETIHGDIADQLGIDQDSIGRILIDKNGPFINRNEDIARVGLPNGPKNAWTIQQREQTDRYCANHPVLNKLFPGYSLEIR